MDKEMEKIIKRKMEKLIVNQKSPKIKTKEFAKAIVDSNEYSSFMKYNKELKDSQTAQDLLRQFQQKQMELQRNGFDPDTLEELKDLQMKINQNDTIQDFIKSQQELVGLLREANNLVNRRIGMQFAFFQGGGCCG